MNPEKKSWKDYTDYKKYIKELKAIREPFNEGLDKGKCFLECRDKTYFFKRSGKFERTELKLFKEK